MALWQERNSGVCLKTLTESQTSIGRNGCLQKYKRMEVCRQADSLRSGHCWGGAQGKHLCLVKQQAGDSERLIIKEGSGECGRKLERRMTLRDDADHQLPINKRVAGTKPRTR